MKTLAERAIDVIVGNEWITVFHSDSHDLICLGCSASFANALPESPDVKHQPRCWVKEIVEERKKASSASSAACLGCGQALRLPCPSCGRLVAVARGRFAAHEQGSCTGSHMQYKNCAGSGKAADAE